MTDRDRHRRATTKICCSLGRTETPCDGPCRWKVEVADDPENGMFCCDAHLAFTVRLCGAPAVVLREHEETDLGVQTPRQTS